MNESTHTQTLGVGDRVLWYEIESILGQGGFGITYRAHDTNLDVQVAIKEYLPTMFATRGADGLIAPTSADQKADYEWGLARFIDEGRTLARFDHPGIVRVYSVFESNGTAYLVMRYEHGEALDSILKREHTLPESRLRGILFDIMGGLVPVHEAGFIHRDIKPANIYIREDGSAVLIDFGSARQALGVQTQTLTTLVSPGYAPFEQYSSDGAQQGPWTDIYALGATAYRAMTGRSPKTAVDRSRALLASTPDETMEAIGSLDNYSAGFVGAIENAIAFHEQDRPQSVAAWQESFGAGAVDVATVAMPQAHPAAGVDLDIGAPATQATEPYEPPTAIFEETEVLPPPVAVTNARSRRPMAVTAGVLAVIVGLAWWRPWHTASVTPVSERATTAAIADGDPVVTDSDGFASAIPSDNGDPEVEALLGAARAHMDAGRLTRPPGNNALENYRAILERDPFNDDAEAGIEDIVQNRVAAARQAAAANDRYLARAYLDEAAGADPANADVLIAEAELENTTPVEFSDVAPTSAPPPRNEPATAEATDVTETLIGQAEKITDPATRRQWRKAQKAARKQNYGKALRELKKTFGSK